MNAIKLNVILAISLFFLTFCSQASFSDKPKINEATPPVQTQKTGTGTPTDPANVSQVCISKGGLMSNGQCYCQQGRIFDKTLQRCIESSPAQDSQSLTQTNTQTSNLQGSNSQISQIGTNSGSNIGSNINQIGSSIDLKQIVDLASSLGGLLNNLPPPDTSGGDCGC